MFNHIVLAYDHTDGSKRALNKVIKLKNVSPESKLTIIHVGAQEDLDRTSLNVAPTTPTPDNMFVGYGPSITKNQSDDQSNIVPERDNDSITLSEVKQTLHSYQIQANYVELHGRNEAEKIHMYAEEHEADLIVVGTNNKSKLEKWVLGSTSEKVTKESSKNVLVVKE